MEKKSSLFILTSILIATSLKIVSAAYYGTFSFSELLNSVDSSLITLGVLLLVFFGLLHFSLGKIFKDNKAISVVLSLAISIGFVYWINKSGFNIENIFLLKPNIRLINHQNKYVSYTSYTIY